ncbi:hypothetical protein ACHHYP_06953 [Achlya hypogyna]|uniref:Uncharacterized protein n=1 Tax=Achlya hypogyna TaxID=1202772 RepID=A0A1V9ZN23_ACHHY|nr:hypothetical protein ACHHYP_06953 [Achlya hypogyna]
MTPKEFLMSLAYESGGEYTCLRLRRGRICMWPFHRSRLTVDPAAEDSLPATIEAAARARFGAAVDTGDFMVTVVNANGEHHVHVCNMPALAFVSDAAVPTVRPIATLVLGSGRRNPTVKHVDWIYERKALEVTAAAKAAELGLDAFGEVLLSHTVQGTTRLLEGLITNFFVLKGGKVYTAGDAVLPGSTRALVMEACNSLGIPLLLEAPVLEESASWEAAFTTSVVRLIVPVATLYRQDQTTGAWATHTVPTAPERLHQLRDMLLSLLATA